MEERFTKIYDKSVWGKNWKGKGGSGKGDGTTPDSKWYINLIINFIKKNNIKTVCDLGCGDWKASRFIPWEELGVNYTGVDVVQSVVDSNNNEYSSDNVGFIHCDISNEAFKGYDLVLIKDVLQHFKDEDILKICDNLILNNSYVISTNGYKFGRSPEKNNWTNRDINNKYSYHPLDINKEPFNKYIDNVKEIFHRRYKQTIVFT
tara:strand:- start:893 stop:1507 length:615 start_codon:yes stop_codon:yes gene_type:complete